MGDDEQLQAAGKYSRGGRCGFGDGKEVGDTASGGASRLRLIIAGDSRSVAGDADAGLQKSPEVAAAVAAAEEEQKCVLLPPRTIMEPSPPTPTTTVTTTSDSRHELDGINASKPATAAATTLPRKSFSLELRQRRSGAGPSSDDVRGHDDDKMADLVLPRRTFSLEENVISPMDFLKGTCSLTSSNLRHRDGRKGKDGSGSEGGGAMWRVEEEKMKTKATGDSAEDEDDEEEGQVTAERRTTKMQQLPAGIPELIEAFLDDGEVPTSEEEEDDIVAAAKASLGELEGARCRSCLEDDTATAALKQQQSTSSLQGAGLGRPPSLQSTCDVSSWSLCHYHSLPHWMQDNEFILSCHRPPLPSFFACFKSIFRLHTETLNIWTHLLGCLAFVAMGAYFLALPREAVWLQEKLAFGAFFGGGAACFALSSAYHTLWCHSPAVGRLFSKLDYCGIALLIMGSFVPWLYYAFYCRGRLLLAYLALVVTLGALAVMVSLWGRFGEPRFRPLRAGVFLAYGLSGVVPALHFAAAEGWRRAVAQLFICFDRRVSGRGQFASEHPMATEAPPIAASLTAGRSLDHHLLPPDHVTLLPLNMRVPNPVL